MTTKTAKPLQPVDATLFERYPTTRDACRIARVPFSRVLEGWTIWERRAHLYRERFHPDLMVGELELHFAPMIAMLKPKIAKANPIEVFEWRLILLTCTDRLVHKLNWPSVNPKIHPLDAMEAVYLQLPWVPVIDRIDNAYRDEVVALYKQSVADDPVRNDPLAIRRLPWVLKGSTRKQVNDFRAGLLEELHRPDPLARFDTPSED